MWLVSLIRNTGAVALLLFLSQLVFAQMAMSEWTSEMHEKYALLKDGSKNGQYEEAFQAMQWLVENHPDAHESIYVFGIKTVKELFKQASDSTVRRSYFQELLSLYDQRAAYFNDRENVYNRKAIDAYMFGKEIPGKKTYEIQLQAFNDFVGLGGKALPSNLLVGYMEVVSNNYKNDRFQLDSLLHYYILITEVFFEQEVNGNFDDKMSSHQELVDKLFINLVDLDCQEIEKQFSSKMEGVKTLYYAKLVAKLSLIFECTDSEGFVKALMTLFDDNPTPRIAAFLGSKMEKGGDHERAEKYLLDAYQLSENDEDKAKNALSVASFYYRNGQKEKSRKYIKAGLKAKPGWDKAYELWGDLYYSSYQECKKGVSQVEDRLVFIAAYEKYKLANNSEKMKITSQGFPDSEHIHFEDYKEQDVVTCECWINEEVSLVRRPNNQP